MHLCTASHLSLLLDYDGTLIPFAATPSRAAPDNDLLRLLNALAVRPRTHIEIVSGRDPSTLGRWFGDVSIALRAEHGAWTRGTGQALWAASVPVRTRAVAVAAERLRRITLPFGGFIERKLTGAAWHHRGLAVSAAAVDDIVERVREELRPTGFEVLRGSCVVEARARGIDKGRAVQDALRRTPRTTVVAIGDDTTDEDMFRALSPRGVGILVGGDERATAASHRFAHVDDVRVLLESLVA